MPQKIDFQNPFLPISKEKQQPKMNGRANLAVKNPFGLNYVRI